MNLNATIQPSTHNWLDLGDTARKGVTLIRRPVIRSPEGNSLWLVRLGHFPCGLHYLASVNVLLHPAEVTFLW